MNFFGLTLKPKLIAAFLLMGSVPFAVVSLLSLGSSSRALEKQAYLHLESVNSIKKAQIQALIQTHEREMDMLVGAAGALRKNAVDKLVAVREIKKTAIKRYLYNIRNQVITLAENAMVTEAMNNFRGAFVNYLSEVGINSSALRRLTKELAVYYREDFAEEFSRLHSGGRPELIDPGKLSNNKVALQHQYIAANKYPLGSKKDLLKADDSSRYSRLHGDFHPIMNNYLERSAYYDIFLVDAANGNIVYSVAKELEYATSLIDGPYAQTNIGEVFRQARSMKKGQVAFVDFAPYLPSYNLPASFIATPIFNAGKRSGVLIFQLSLDRITKVMSERAGLGITGETILVGPDYLMRSDSYLDPVHHSVIASFNHPKTGRVNTSATRAGIERGETGVQYDIDYRQQPTIIAHAPINFQGVRWVLNAKIDIGEAYVPRAEDADKDYYKHYIEKYGYADLFLISADGYVFYSATNKTHYQQNILQAEHEQSSLGQVVRTATDRQQFAISDFRPLSSSANTPMAFMAQPIIHQGQVEMIVALQVSPKSINQLMRQREGMGETGETYLVGSDGLMRSDSYRDPQKHSVLNSFAHPAEGRIDTLGVKSALAGKTGVDNFIGYHGQHVLSAFTPVSVGDTRWALITEIDQGEAFRASREIQLLILVLGVIGIGLIGVVGFLVARNISNPVVELTQAMTGLAGGDLGIDVPVQQRSDEIGAMAQAAQVFKDALQKTVDQNWIQTNAADISDVIQRTDSRSKAAGEILSRLVPLLDSGHGLFYRHDEGEQRLELLASYAHSDRKNLGNGFALGEGLVGQCALERKPITLQNVPDDYIRIHSGLGEAVPNTVMAVPLLLQGELRGAIEIASFKPFSPRQQKLLNELAPVIALYMDNLTKSVQTQQLLVQTQSQTEALRVSEEELKLREEELKASNEELRGQAEVLQRQTAELQASEEELKTQQEELKTTNEELIEKTEALQEQQDTLEIAREKAEEDARELQRASHYKSQFLANMSHELRTPLNSLLILSKGLADNDSGNLDADDIESAQTIYESGDTLLHLINDILDLSKVEAGEVELSIEAVRLADVAQDIERNFRHVAADKGLELSVEMDDSLPESLATDRGKLQQILNNLLSNAFKFTEAGQVKVAFQRPSAGVKAPIADSDAQAWLAIAVTDSGVGIPEDKQSMIFEAFKQADGSTSRRFGGTGLGLSISQKFAALIGGVIQVESEPGRGSVFTLFLPLKEVAPPALAREPEHVVVQPMPAPAAPPFADDRDSIGSEDKTILVIEDDLKFAKILYDRAHRKGFKCIVAPDGEIGLRLVQQYPPTGIILDIGLPNIDGWTVMSQLKSSTATRHIPVHVISALDEHGKGMEKGAVGYLTKPVSQQQITSAFERIEHFTTGTLRHLLIIEDDAGSRQAITSLVASDEVMIRTANSGEEALSMLKAETFDCIILDLGLPGMNGFQFLEQASQETAINLPPVVIYSGRELTAEENIRLREYTDSIVIKGTRSPERLLDEVTLFLHSVHETLPEKQRQILSQVLDRDKQFADKKVLVVDDDMRSAFALSKALRAKGLGVEMAKDGESALAKLNSLADIDLVLMDVMMPGMDGFEATREIRKQQHLHNLPVIAVTAKAMLGDREACLEAGANDYLSKPIDIDKLLSMIRVWL